APLGREGMSSVVFDYRGIGGSGGKKDVRRFLDDGRAMWLEAVRIAGGREDRIVIRAGSLGTLIAADLLERGAAPAGVILFAPVRSSSIVHNAIASRRGALLATLTSGFYPSPNAPNLEDVLGATTVPMLIVMAEDDEYLPAGEASIIADAAAKAGHTVIHSPGDHQSTVLRSWNFVLEPSGLGGRLAEELADDELRFLADINPVRRDSATPD
ncbi:MAG: alpha/beta hydrolase, partial [Phycisphaerales bacterium]|nr:alpha/beta hydrolase [Phycisphaerales bacterium]